MRIEFDVKAIGSEPYEGKGMTPIEVMKNRDAEYVNPRYTGKMVVLQVSPAISPGESFIDLLPDYVESCRHYYNSPAQNFTVLAAWYPDHYRTDGTLEVEWEPDVPREPTPSVEAFAKDFAERISNPFNLAKF